MRFRALWLVAVLSALLLAALPTVAASGLEGFERVELTRNDAWEGTPDVWGDRIVWDSFATWSSATNDVFTWSPGSGIVQVSESGGLHHWAKASGDRLAWYGMPTIAGPGQNAWEAFTWTSGQGLQRLTTNAVAEFDVAVSGDRVVWKRDLWNCALYTWTPAEGERWIASGDNMYYLDVDGDRAVWEGTGGTDGGTDFEIFTWTPDGGKQQLTTDTDSDYSPRISGERVVWYRYSAGGIIHVMTWTPLTGVQEIESQYGGTPEVSGDRIVWTGGPGEDGGSDTEVFTWTPAEGVRQITQDSVWQEQAIVSGDRIMWSATGGIDGGTDREVFAWSDAGGVTQLSCNGWYDTFMALSGDRYVWVSQSGSDHGQDPELYTAVATGIAPKVDVFPAEVTFGQVGVGDSTTQLVTIANSGNETLTASWSLDDSLSEVTFGTDRRSAEITPGQSVDVPLVFAPTVLGDTSGRLRIDTNVVGRDIVFVALSGTCAYSESPPDAQIADMLDLIDESVAAGELSGAGQGSSGAGRLGALINMIEAAGDLIEEQRYDDALQQLRDVYARCDGQTPPPDFVAGTARDALASRVSALIATVEAMQ